jgi:heat shock protein HspQ
MPIYVEEYKQTDEYFDELVTNIRNIIIDPVYAVLQSKNDDLRLKGISELFLTLFDTKNSIEIESDFGKNQ